MSPAHPPLRTRFDTRDQALRSHRGPAPWTSIEHVWDASVYLRAKADNYAGNVLNQPR
eukprot:jgi/Phyca11/512189/fgenesh2_kg.PHYCAscaffold_481_\